MRIVEVDLGGMTDTSAGIDTGRLVALTKFLMGRARDTGTDGKISLQAFLSIANSLNVGITKENLTKLMAADNPDPNSALLRNYIANVTPTEVIFKGAENTATALPNMKPEQSQAVVDQMAKRAIK